MNACTQNYIYICIYIVIILIHISLSNNTYIESNIYDGAKARKLDEMLTRMEEHKRNNL